MSSSWLPECEATLFLDIRAEKNLKIDFDIPLIFQVRDRVYNYKHIYIYIIGTIAGGFHPFTY